jgi:glycosyltransferase involved in cell wall biosynthesis
MSTLLENIARTPGIEIEVATAYPTLTDGQFEENGVKYCAIRQPKRPYVYFACREKDLARCVRLVHERRPDVVHIHGLERFYGLMAARKLISAPCVISLQGFMTVGERVFYGALSPVEIWRSHRLMEFATLRGLFWVHRAFVRGARQEREILSGAPRFLGRTAWDRAQVRYFNPNAKYFHVGELLRDAFSRCTWDLSTCDRHSVIYTNAGRPHRGTEVLLRAMVAVKREFPDAKLLLAGAVGTRSGYERFLRRTIVESGLGSSVELLGYLDASALARQLSRAHVFAMSSFMENSSNSLCEAMQVGLPCIGTSAGGTVSLIDHGRTGSLTPTGDAPVMASEILRIFRDDEYARRIGAAAREEASERHAPQRVLSQLLAAYRAAIAGNPPAAQISPSKRSSLKCSGPRDVEIVTYE